MFYLDLEELPDDTRPGLYRLSQVILCVIRDLFKHKATADDLQIELHINSGYLPSAMQYDSIKRLDEGSAYAIGPPDGYSKYPSLNHIMLTKRAVEPGGEYRFAVQLAHELGHFLFGIQHNSGLIETFCVSLSFVVLAKLADYAKANPGFGFDPRLFIDQRDFEISCGLNKFPKEICSAIRSELWYQLSLYLRYKQTELNKAPDTKSYDYSFYNLGAAVLTSESIPWPEMAGIGALGQWRAEGTAPRRGWQWHLELAQLTPNVQQSLRRLGRGSDRAFVIAKFDTPRWLFGGFRFYEEGKFVWLVEFPKQKREIWEKKIAALRPSSVLWEDGCHIG